MEGCSASLHPLLASPAPLEHGPPSGHVPAFQASSGSVGGAAPSVRSINKGATTSSPTPTSSMSMVAIQAPGQLAGVFIEVGGAAQGEAGTGLPRATRRGLSLDVVFKNHMLKAAKATAGRNLTAAEVEVVGRHVTDRWGQMDKPLQREVFDSWRASLAQCAPLASEPCFPPWGGGSW